VYDPPAEGLQSPQAVSLVEVDDQCSAARCPDRIQLFRAARGRNDPNRTGFRLQLPDET
jgi:hypothetical protein